MSLKTWWSRFTPRARTADLGFDAQLLPMADWQLVGQESEFAHWQDAVGDVISLTSSPTLMPSLSDPVALQHYCRRIAESQRAGLIEVSVRAGADGPCLTYVYKRLEKPAFRVFGVVVTPGSKGSWIWMVLTGERGVTGVREAVVTAQLMESEQLTLQTYESSWAQDPYDPKYAGVDRSTLRYLSDALEYDVEFPDHPLTKTRRELNRLAAIRLPNLPAA